MPSEVCPTATAKGSFRCVESPARSVARAVTCHGFVREENGSPVDEAVVRFSVAEAVRERIRRLNADVIVPTIEATTDADGRFEFAGLPHFAGAHLIVRTLDGREAKLRLPEDIRDPLVLTLDR